MNIVPRYLPRYGMAPDWAKATRPLVFVFTAICFLVTILFQANVNAQGGAYATGVLMLMTSAAVAVTISSRRRGEKVWVAFMLITLVFAYTTIVNMIAQPSGIQIASLFIFGIIASSFISRALRTTEVRIDDIAFDAKAIEFINELQEGDIRIVTNRRETGDISEYRFKEHEKRIDNHIPSTDPVLFYEVELGDASEFKGGLLIRGVDVGGIDTSNGVTCGAQRYAALLISVTEPERSRTLFRLERGESIMYLARYILFGEGDTAPVTREILRQAEEDPELRPNVHVGG